MRRYFLPRLESLWFNSSPRHAAASSDYVTIYAYLRSVELKQGANQGDKISSNNR